jgi:alginate O-acetyltransferase complex protein AlgI
VWLKTYLEVLRFTFNAYFQFSGYSDVAIGLSIMMGYKIMENFNYPFLATNMREFWGRYHMSLSVFCKDYIYTPIASYYRKPVIGIIATMLIIGLWHEVSLRYLLWGVVQACGIYMATLIKPRRTSFLMKNLSRLSVAHYFAFSCVIVSQDTLAGALHIYKTLFFIG